MLEGKMPVNAVAMTSNNPGEPLIQERIIYKDGENKENKELEEELRNK